MSIEGSFLGQELDAGKSLNATGFAQGQGVGEPISQLLVVWQAIVVR